MTTAAPTATIHRSDFDAILFDLDGVVTDTARAHAASWKRLFDELLRERAKAAGERFVPFDKVRDYLHYVDGKPRLDGARDFLKSRSIVLPDGDADDAPGNNTLSALAKRKNEIFHQHLEKHGVDAFDSTVSFIRDARRAGFKTAIISSSRNCEPVLEAAGLTHLFDAKVDGKDLAQLHLEGKPDPAMFLRAAKLLNVTPERAVVVEDAVSGVEAGRDGKFGMVIGIDRRGEGDQLLKHGATVVVRDMEEIVIESDQDQSARTSSDLPLAIDASEEIFERVRGRRTVVFLDYDGTLTPIVERPEDAVLSDEMRKGVKELARSCPVAVISGRDLQDVRKRVGLDDVFYAGSHGFEIAGPAGFAAKHDAGREFLPMLDAAETELREAVEGFDSAQVERKRYSIAVHYRRVKDHQVTAVEKAVDDVLARHDRLRKTHGKKVFDMQPAVNWNKGRAVQWLLNAMKLDPKASVAVYLGDDTTDEDAFAVLGKDITGVGIIVADEGHNRSTKAEYRLRDVGDVAQFLRNLAAALARDSQ